MFKKGEKVKLKTFNGRKTSPKSVSSSENYWKLIGQTGTIQQDPQDSSIFASFSKELRVLVKFDKELVTYGLIAHNKIENSLWILVSDLETTE
jgi:hypothetical protein